MIPSQMSTATSTTSGSVGISSASSSRVAVGPVGTLLFFSILMIVCPLSTFFFVRGVLVSQFASDYLTASISAAVCAILAVHGVVAMFVYKAYHEKDDGPSAVDREHKVPQKID